MNSTTIYRINRIKQDAKVGNMYRHRMSFTNFLHSLIREYGTVRNNNYYIEINDLSTIDKRLLLSNFLDASEFEWAAENATRLEQVFNEYKDHLQTLLDDECYSVYCENMESEGMRCVRHPNHDEVYWVKS